MKKKFKIGLIGFGTVGKGLYQLLTDNNINAFEVTRICVKQKGKKRDCQQELLTYEINDIINDSGIDIVVELIDDVSKSYEIVTTALKKGKRVISANKKMIAEHNYELQQLAQTHKTHFLFEASTCASIPILHLLDNFYTSGSISSIHGILNGSSNYVLTKMSDENQSYESALKLAQQKGFAESNPQLDMNGSDSKYKLSILISKAFGRYIDPSTIPCFGIEDVTKEDLTIATFENKSIKLIGHVSVENDHLYYWVAPSLIDRKDSLALVELENNAVVISSQIYFGEHLIQGKGAGALPTAYAIIADLQKFAQQNITTLNGFKKKDESVLPQYKYEDILIRVKDEKSIENKIFQKVTFLKGINNYLYYVVRANINEIYKDLQKRHRRYTVVGIYKEGLSESGVLKYAQAI